METDYTKIHDVETIVINITTENYTFPNNIKIKIKYNKNVDYVCDRDISIYRSVLQIKNDSQYVTNIPRGSNINILKLYVPSISKKNQTDVYKFIFYKKLEKLSVNFKDGEKYPIIHINNILPYERNYKTSFECESKNCCLC
ncbi:hypothetical protein [Niemeyer virus]|uniref:Uncharacterized protein n=1 Tax=Acanthamoeba polyphaga mimivirus Kroon TaxID=3069720 RepID=A0A0G2YBT9_9VIRU|nr:hypothetical protein QJ850_gp183 [Acanthamoeba polyphaga mimivirus]AKI80516.1 hypothetical protein [Acanthamoeba polyphaga mimivirus Kroon]ALR84432.1 hypothetical protein [Niemeyer virus]